MEESEEAELLIGAPSESQPDRFLESVRDVLPELFEGLTEAMVCLKFNSRTEVNARIPN